MSSKRPIERDSVTSSEVDGMFDFGPDVERPATGPVAALPPWMVEQQRAARQTAQHEAELPHAGQTIGIRLARQAALVTVGADATVIETESVEVVETTEMFESAEDVTPEPAVVPEFARIVPAPRKRRKPLPADHVVIAAPAVDDGAGTEDTEAEAELVETELVEEIVDVPVVPAPRAETSPALAVLPLEVANDAEPVAETPVAKPVVRRPRRRWVGIAQAAGIIAIGAGVGVYASGGVGFLQNRTTGNPPTQEASAWVLNNLAGVGTVLIPSSLADGLISNGQDSDALTTYRDGDVASVDLGKGCCDYMVLIGKPGQEPGTGLPDSVHTLFERSRPAAIFTTGAGWTQVRQVLPGSPTKVAKDLAADHEALVATGKTLIASGKVELSDVAKQQVQDGQVDARVLIGIVAIALQHDITIASFPAQPGESDPSILRRSVAISEIDGKPVKDGSDRVKAIKDVLGGQEGIYRPSGAEVHAVDGVTALEFRYDAPSPFGVLTLNDEDGKPNS